MIVGTMTPKRMPNKKEKMLVALALLEVEEESLLEVETAAVPAAETAAIPELGKAVILEGGVEERLQLEEEALVQLD
jgi:hypothetical protein